MEVEENKEEQKEVSALDMLCYQIGIMLDDGQKIYLAETCEYKIAPEKTNPKWFHNCMTIDYDLWKKLMWFSMFYKNMTPTCREILKYVDSINAADNVKYARFLFLNKPMCIEDRDYVVECGNP